MKVSRNHLIMHARSPLWKRKELIQQKNRHDIVNTLSMFTSNATTQMRPILTFELSVAPIKPFLLGFFIQVL